MEQIRTYLLSVIAAAVICSIVMSLPGKTGTVGTLRKLLTGIFMTITMISPLTSLHLPDMQTYMDAFRADATAAVQAGEILTSTAAADIIKSRTEAYILDKAECLGARLNVEVSLSEDSTLAPYAVKLSGDVSPYAKKRLTEIIEDDLGISREDQLWTNEN